MSQVRANEQGMAYALLESPSQAEGIEVAYQVVCLPVLTIWKNVGTEKEVQASKQHIANVQDGTPLIVESAPTVRINEQ